MSREGIPGFWAFSWLLWMQPVTLHRHLKGLNVRPNAKLKSLLRSKHHAERVYARAMLIQLVFWAPLLNLLTGVILSTAGFPINWVILLVGVTTGVAAGAILSMATDVAFGATFSVAISVGIGVTASVTPGVTPGVAAGVATGVAAGVATGVATGVAIGVAFGGAIGLAMGAAFGLFTSVVFGVAEGVTEGVAFGVVFGIVATLSSFITFIRIPFYPFELAAMFLVRNSGESALRFCPVLYHDLGYLPLPLLEGSLVAAAEREPALVHRLLAACNITPLRARTARRALVRIHIGELRALLQNRNYTDAAELKGGFLPGVEEAGTTLTRLAEIARYLNSASRNPLAYQRLEKLKKAADLLRHSRNRLTTSNALVDRQAIVEVVPLLETAIDEMRQTAEREAAHVIPNPFRPNAPLDPEAGDVLFRGREGLVREIQTLLDASGAGASVVLLGPRRTGKTSLLKMLPQLLPDAICVFFDLQDNPVRTPADLFGALVKRAREQAARQRNLKLPAAPDGPPIASAANWLETVDRHLEGRRLLLCIDEFERLEKNYSQSPDETLQVLGLIRATIQHRRNIRILVSGAVAFEDLGRLWHDHLINAHELRVPFLDRATSLDLLQHPLPELDLFSAAVAEKIYAQTGGQPMLVQTCAWNLVNRLNEDDRRDVTDADLAAVFDRILTGKGSYFRDTLDALRPETRLAFEHLVLESTEITDRTHLRRLRERLLIDAAGQPTMPLLTQWLQENQ